MPHTDSTDPRRRKQHAAVVRRARTRNLDAMRAMDRARWNPVAAAHYRRQKTYGLTPDQYRDLLVGQAGRCLVCHRVPEKGLGSDFNVDHDHVTGRVRGLLCGPCNRGLAAFRDDPRRLTSAIRYLAAP